MNANAGGNADKNRLENDITIRKWEEKDCFAVSEIEKLCFPDPWTEEMVIGSFSDDYFLGYVAETKGKIIGYIAENRGKVIAYVGLSIVFDTADILLVAVLKEFRNRGLASRLLLDGLDLAVKLGAERAMLEVETTNEAAIKCYQKLGFLTIAERKNYYGEHRNAYIMEKRLLNDL